MTKFPSHRVTNWRESCMLSSQRHHAVTDHPPRHDLSLPAAGRVWRAQDDAPSTQLSRSKSDRGEPRDQSRGACASFRTHSAIMWGSRGFRVAQKSCASRAPCASSIRPWTPPTPISRTPQGPFRSTIAPTRCRTSPAASSTRSGERGWPLGSSIPATQWVDRHSRASHPALTGHQSRLPL